MPHQCTNCGRAFEDGSKEMLSGCPDCGGNKFQFHPADAVDEDPDPAAEPPDPPTPDRSVARTVGSAAATVRDLVGSGSTPEDPTPGAPGPTAEQGTTDTSPSPGTPDPTPSSPPATEDTAQADARSEVVSPDELPGSTTETTPPDDTARASSAEDTPRLNASDDAADDADTDRPDLTDLREELNDQFESIKVLSPGQYELNLMELYDREEYIIALQEDGRYTIQVPERWHDD